MLADAGWGWLGLADAGAVAGFRGQGQGFGRFLWQDGLQAQFQRLAGIWRAWERAVFWLTGKHYTSV